MLYVCIQYISNFVIYYKLVIKGTQVKFKNNLFLVY